MARKLQAMFANDEYPVAGYDGGNVKAKLSLIVNSRNIDPTQPESRYFRDSIEHNAVIEINRIDYNQEAARHKGRKPNYGYLEYNGKYYVVGDAALPYIRDHRELLNNKAKYTREYYGLQFVRGLLSVYNGNPPADLHVIAGHAPLNNSKREAIVTALQGNWVVKSMHETIKFRVHTVFVEDEITCAALNQRYRITGDKNSNFRQDGLVLGVDIGGGTVDVMYINENGYPVDGTHDSVAIGLSECVWNFKYLFDETYGHLFPHSAKGISLESVYQIYMDPDHRLYTGAVEGGQLECQDLFLQSTMGELNRLYGAISNIAPDFETRARGVNIYGGSGELVLKELADSIFENYANNGRLFLPTTEKGKSILSAARGMCKLGERLRKAELHVLKKEAS